MSLRKKGLFAIYWSFGQQFGVQIIQFVVSIILARVLLPEEFGLVGMTAVFMALGSTLSDSGLSSSLIRTKDPDQGDLSTVFFINILVSTLIYFILFASSSLIADFYRQPILQNIVKVYGLSFFIRSFSTIHYTRLTIALDFKSQTIIKIPSLVLSSALGLFLAYSGYGVWSLVYMHLAQVIIETISIWIKLPWYPSLIIDRKKLFNHFNFGYKIALSSIINTIYLNVYHIIIGKFYSAAQLGFFTRAESMKQLPVNNISAVLAKVTYPLFSSIQGDNLRLKSVYKKLMQQVTFWIAPVMILAGVLAEPLFRFLLTEKWLPAVPYFQILCLTGILYPLHSYNLNILQVKGRSDLFLKLEIIKKIIVTIGIFIAIPFGIYGLLWAKLILSLNALAINSYYSGRMIQYSIGEQMRDVFPIVGFAFLVGFIVYLVDSLFLLEPGFDLIRLIIGGISGMGVYLFVASWFKLTAILDFKELILKR